MAMLLLREPESSQGSVGVAHLLPQSMLIRNACGSITLFIFNLRKENKGCSRSDPGWTSLRHGCHARSQSRHQALESSPLSSPSTTCIDVRADPWLANCCVPDPRRLCWDCGWCVTGERGDRRSEVCRGRAECEWVSQNR